MKYTVEKPGWFVNPQRLQVLRVVWHDLGIDGILDERVKPVLSQRNDAAHVERILPNVTFRFPRPFIAGELGYVWEVPDFNIMNDQDTIQRCRSGYRMILDERGLFGNAWDQGDVRLTSREGIFARRTNIRSLVEQHLDKARRVQSR